MSWYPGERAELRARFAGPEAPFQFGYAQQGGMGIILTGWRKEVA